MRFSPRSTHFSGTLAILAVFSLLAPNVVSAQGGCLAKYSTPSLLHCIGNMTDHVFQVISGSAIVPNAIGQYQQCQYDLNGTTMCVIDDVFQVGAAQFPLVQGMCVPSECSATDIRGFWSLMHCVALTPGLDKEIQLIWNQTCEKLNTSSTCYSNFYLLEKLLHQITFSASTISAVQVHCGNNKVEDWSAGGIVMLIVCSIVSLLVLANIILEAREATYNTPSEEDGERAALLNSQVRTLGSLQDVPPGSVQVPVIGYGRNGTMDVSEAAPNPPSAVGVLQKEMHRRSLSRRLLALFSLRDNYDLLMKKEAARSLGCLDGIRTISMMWIILGHTGDFQGPGFVGFDNLKIYMEMFERFTFQLAVSAQFCVDSFFFLSGLLTYYVLARKFAKSQSAPPFFMAVILRFLRLMPLLGFVIGFYSTIANHFGAGPLWYKYTLESDRCTTWAWSNLVFVNNFAPEKYGDQCMPWTWYLANDMQFFVFALLVFCLVYCRKPVGGAIVMALSTIASVIYTLVYSYDNSLTMSSGAGQDTIYDKPWPRFAPFGVGCLTAIYFADVLKKSQPFKNRMLLANVLMAISIGGLVTIVYISYDFFNHTWSRTQNTLYLGLTRVCFSICLAILTTLCTYNAGGFVNWFLTRPYMEPLGKLTFGAYLVHPIVIRVAYFSLVDTIHYTDIEYAVYFVAFAVLSYSIALVLYLTIELPVAGLIGMLLPKK